MSYIVIAPHADDEIIGCYELLTKWNKDIKVVLFPSQQAIDESGLSSQIMKFDRGHTDYLPTIITKSDVLVFPDPIYELHPEHRKWGQIGEQYARSGHKVIFYTTNMLAPYIHEVEFSFVKKEVLDRVYFEKQQLWLYDHKYFLFEGYTSWILSWND